jgi:hypothetical protein
MSRKIADDEYVPIMSLCKPVAEVQIIEATLSLEGYAPFVCDEENPPANDTRYLKQTITANHIADQRNVLRQTTGTPVVEWGPISSGDGKTTREVRDIDPYTGMTCITEDVGFTIGAGFTEDKAQCLTTRRVFESTAIANPCDPEGEIERKIVYQLSIPYTISNVAGNVSNLLNLFSFDNLPCYNCKGTVLSGTKGTLSNSALAIQAAGTKWEAAYTVSGNTVTKSKIRVRFLADVQFTLRTKDENGNVSDDVVQAEKDDVLEYFPPNEEGSIEVLACQPLAVCLLPQVGGISYKSVGVNTRRIENPDPDPDPEGCNLFYVSADGRFYENLLTEVRNNVDQSGTSQSSFTDESGTTTTSQNFSFTGLLSVTITKRNPCEIISQINDSEATRVYESCVDDDCSTCTTTFSETSQTDSPTGCNSDKDIADFVSFFSYDLVSQESSELPSCECKGKAGKSTYELNTSGCEGNGSIESEISEQRCEVDSLKIRRAGKENFSESCSFSGEFSSGSSSGNWQLGDFVEDISLLKDELIDPFAEERGSVLDPNQPENTPNATCAEIAVTSTSSTTKSITEIEWDITVTPSIMRDENDDAFEHKVHFQFIVAEQDTENPYCPTLKYVENTDYPLDTRTSKNAYEVKKTTGNITVSRARLQKCIVNAAAVMEVVYD